ncbi:Vacuolar protein sorting-associated protein 4 [Symbiodinium microadriaticum]|uniref:Vacuolar protein sorting-associated protein 4 n=1 Tax=Symbiodinium microadriaticum TaxID=2951 RepID=A0A1Q9C1U6_SYMMI|nr:Vacuolar protein sorting-associated protein 4 [Symbiodinium microadriaticum]
MKATESGDGSSTVQLFSLERMDLDSAIRRRFEKRVYIPLPDLEARVRLLTLHLGDTPHSCTPEAIRGIAAQTDGYSGADISILTRDALFEPVRKCQRARAFKRVERVTGDGKRSFWTPCSPGEPGAVPMTLMEVPASELLSPDVEASDFEVALEKVRPSVSPGDLKSHEEFTSMFGMEG